MTMIKYKEFLKGNWFWVILIGFIVYFFISISIDDKIIEKNGKIATITVEYYKHNRNSKVAGGYFYVKNKRYEYHYRYNLPLGSTFKIKYNPDAPEMYRQIDE